MIFQDESFANLATGIERKFAVIIRFSNGRLKDYRFTAIFKEEAIDEGLKALQLTKKFNYKIMKKDIYIY